MRVNFDFRSEIEISAAVSNFAPTWPYVWVVEVGAKSLNSKLRPRNVRAKMCELISISDLKSKFPCKMEAR